MAELVILEPAQRELEEIAREAALSVSRFSSLFHRYYGEPPMQYLNRKRMNLAAQQLLYHAGSCKQIAEMTGFADQFHFSRHVPATMPFRLVMIRNLLLRSGLVSV